MKKIITAVAAVAMATTMFAADVAATVKMAGDLFNLGKDGKSISALEIKDDATADYKAAVTMSVSGDKAGATVKYANRSLDLCNQTIWFTPIDALKITLGNTDVNINQEKIDWCNSDIAVGGYGYRADVNVDALSASVMLLPGEGNYWLNGKNAGLMAAKIGYSADWGSVGGMFEMDGKKLMFGAGYAGAVDATSYFATFGAYMNEGKMTSLRGEAYVSTAIESVGISAFIPVTFVMDEVNCWSNQNWHVAGIQGKQDWGCPQKKNQVLVGTTLKVTAPIGSCGGYLYVKQNDWLADKFSINVKPGLTGSCGIMGWEVAIDTVIGYQGWNNDANADWEGKFSFTVPVTFTINF